MFLRIPTWRRDLAAKAGFNQANDFLLAWAITRWVSSFFLPPRIWERVEGMAARTRKRLRTVTALLPPGQAPQGDRRDTDRTACGFTCACSLITLRQQPPFWPAKVRDVSSTGIGLLISQAMPPGTFLAIHMSEHPCFDRPLQAKVVHSTHRRSEKCWVVGCTFSRQLSADEVRALASSNPLVIPD